MVCLGIDMVHADDIGAQSLHESSIASTLLSIDKWIVCILVLDKTLAKK